MNLIGAIKILPVLVSLWVNNWFASCYLNFFSEKLVSPTIPLINQKTIQNRKIRIGFIDQGTPFWDHHYLSSLGHKDVNFNFKKRDHSTAVISAFLLQLESEIPNAREKIEIVICSNSSLETNGLIFCLQNLYPENLDYLNISMNGKEPSDHEKTLLTLIAKNTIITLAAGNEGRSQESFPCAYNLQNTVCVGNINHHGYINYSSNYGYWVNTYDFGVDVRVFDSELSAPTSRTGTSFSSPIHMARLVSGSIRGDKFDYVSAKENFNKNHGIVKVQHASK